MASAQIDQQTPRKPIRLWPAVVIAAVQWFVGFIVPLVFPDLNILALLFWVGAGVAVFLWWLFFSRAPWSERVGVLVLMPIAVFLTKRFLVHPSLDNAAMGRMVPLLSIPFMSLALVVGVAATRRLSSGYRRAAIAVCTLLVCGGFAMVRTGGITGDARSDLHWRWTPTPEQRLLAQATEEPAATTAPAAAAEKALAAPTRAEPAPSTTPAAAKVAEKPAAPPTPEPQAIWPGFRGPNRDAVVRGVRIETDWSKSPPVELWRRPIGPAWSSFAVRRDLVYTQEQRGDDEDVSCYRLTSGKLVWRHRDAARFWESNGGPGPRGTPTVVNGRVYTLGATGIVNALDADNGAVVWSRNAATDTGAKLPGWGFAGSPLVIGDLVVVAASGRLAAYDVASGTLRWVRQTAGGGYSSPHLATIDGVAQIVLLSGGGATGVAPADGAVLWQRTWEPGVSIVQPGMTENGDVLVSGGDAMGGTGIHRIALAHRPAGWTVEERWTTRGLKPYFNDFVAHKGYAFGFDGSILSCIDLNDGQRKWKGGRYGSGQLLLLPDEDLLLVVSEEGELALVKATPDEFTELARFKAIEGKTWNHPALARDVLLIRNGEEMAAFRLPLGAR